MRFPKGCQAIVQRVGLRTLVALGNDGGDSHYGRQTDDEDVLKKQ